MEKQLLQRSVVTQEPELLSRLGVVDGFEPKGAPPDHVEESLGPWTFRAGSVGSFGGNLNSEHPVSCELMLKRGPRNHRNTPFKLFCCRSFITVSTDPPTRGSIAVMIRSFWIK